MRRKSERNKSKGSPEKKVEKATRKSTRRRGKRATSSSPEREDGEGKSVDVPKAQESTKESTTGQPTTRLKIKELKTIAQEESSTKQISSSSSSSSSVAVAVAVAVAESVPTLEKIPEGAVAGAEGASVWKVARADASPGEIQKLKLCRQRNPSEASDSSSSRKKSHKSYESGEGDGDEGDSAEELPRLRKRDFGSERQDDPSSSNPGQDSKEEVSHCREILPRTTSANFTLSDDKKNVDRLADNNADQAIRYDQNCPVQKSPDTQICKQEELSSNGDDYKDNKVPVVKQEVSYDSVKDSEEGRKSEEEKVKEREENVKEGDGEGKEKEIKEADEVKEVKKVKEVKEVKEAKEAKEEKQVKEEVKEEKKEEKEKENEVEKEGGDETEAVVRSDKLPAKETSSQADDEVKEEVKVEPEPKESSSDEDKYKRQNPEPASEAKSQAKRGEVRASLRTLRRKHRNKYHESSDSDTPESEDEPSEKKAEETQLQEEPKEAEDTGKSRSPSPENRLSFKAATDVENKIPDPSETEERINNSGDDKPREEASVNARTADYKPAKVNLKRAFSARVTETEEAIKKEDSEKNGESETSVPVKENHATTEENDGKNSLPRKRRWGTAYTAESTPVFTVSTDSLKALVPGAKPLSITEVRLSKDDDEEKERRQEREKRHSVGEDSGDQKVRDDGAPTKNENTKKGDLKYDNHLGTKRKISILKEAPRIKSPSPPSAKATNILLIKNLVRPFTLNQIKELLSRTGTIVENGFWIDGIKSKCYVVYANEDQAFETRQALHGISWPISNPKRLHVEYANKEDMELARELSKDQPIVRKTEPLLGGDTWQQVWTRDDKQNAALKVPTVREWDVGKEDGNQVKEKEREKKDLDKKRRQRSRSPPVEPHLPPPARKFKKKEDEPPPAKLLDDLFKKTKAIPCIYWLPLTNEQIVVKEEMRRQHMAEHARRLEEMKRAERSRDPTARRRRSPRK